MGILDAYFGVIFITVEIDNLDANLEVCFFSIMVVRKEKLYT